MQIQRILTIQTSAKDKEKYRLELQRRKRRELDSQLLHHDCEVPD